MRFPNLDRFTPMIFATKKEKAKKFVTGLTLILQLILASFSYASLTEVVMRELKVENAHKRHHVAKGSRQSCDQHQRSRGQDHEGPR